MARPVRVGLAEASGRWRRCRSWLAAPLLLLGAAAVGLLPRSALRPRLLFARSALLQSADADAGAAGLADPNPSAHCSLTGFLNEVRSTIRPLEEQVDQGKLVPQFGQRAEMFLAAYSGKSGDAELERAVDAMLHALFLRQLPLLRQQLAAKYDKAAKPLAAVAEADERFVAAAEQLKRPGSDWNYDHERYALRAVLEGGLKREQALGEERMLSAQTQQSTVEVISRMQSQMESLQQKVQAMRAGSPWFLSASYRIPKTPFQLIGRYQQGRTNLELSLNQDRDPANQEAGMVQGFGPMNLGVNVNLGM